MFLGANNKGKGKETVKNITEGEKENQLVEVILSDSEGPFHLLADKSIATTIKVKKIKNHMSGVNLLYIYLLIRLRFILQKFNYFIGDQQKNKKRKIDTQSPTNERKSNRIKKQAGTNNK